MGDQPVATPLPNTDIYALSEIRTHDSSARVGEDSSCLRAAAHQLLQDKHQDMRQKTQTCFIRDSSASWLRRVCGGVHNLIRFNCAPFFASCRTHRVFTVTCLDACRCAAYLRLRDQCDRQMEKCSNDNLQRITEGLGEKSWHGIEGGSPRWETAIFDLIWERAFLRNGNHPRVCTVHIPEII
jgi:hypothetical protein